jgi:hypothetical protein
MWEGYKLEFLESGRLVPLVVYARQEFLSLTIVTLIFLETVSRSVSNCHCFFTGKSKEISFPFSGESSDTSTPSVVIRKPRKPVITANKA